MPDILKSAQGQIDDAAAQVGTPAAAPPPTDPNQQNQPTHAEPEDLNLPYSTRAQQNPTDDKKDGTPPELEPVSVVPPPIAIAKKRSSSKSLIIAVLLFLVATLPLAVYFTSQQRQLNDLRGRAQEGAYPCSSDDQCGGGSCNSVTRRCSSSPTGAGTTGVHASIGSECDDFGTGTQCHGQVTINVCPDGPTGHGPGPICNNPIGTQTGNVDCVAVANQHCAFTQLDTGNGSGMTCYPTGCQQSSPSPSTTTSPGGGTNPPPGGGTNPPPGGGTNPPGGSNPTATPTSTPTATPIPGGTCELIKLYDTAGAEITQAVKDGTKKLAIGEQITIATTKGNATKAHFRIQGIADWAENDPSKTTTTEYRLTITIPSALTQAQGTFEVEVFVNGQWK